MTAQATAPITLVIGSGPGGATVARELARGGQRVLIIERGKDWRGSRFYGTYPGAVAYADKNALLFSSEGFNIVRPLMLGGATSMYCGCSANPGDWWLERYGIDLRPDAAAAAAELKVAPLAPELRGRVSTRIAEAAGVLGMSWAPQEKMMQPGRTKDFDCGAKCMLGCRCGAKWSAAEWIDEAVAHGAELWTDCRVDRVLTSGRTVVGVEGVRSGKYFRIDAERVVVAAGGIGTPILLRKSGFSAAGDGLTVDTTAMVYGHAQGTEGRQGDEPPMTWSFADDDLRVLYSTLIDPWLMYPLIMARKGPLYPLTWQRWGRTLGIMIKVKDEISGGVDGEGRIWKDLTARDRERLGAAEAVAGKILREAGCSPGSIFTTPLRGTHPGSTARIDTVVGRDLQTEVEGLFVCDASVFPEALGRPTVLTIIALARRLSRRLLV